ncbi:MAG: hypothetical protein SEPTF4163_002777 [Sporothrix epigloea]
MRSPSVPPLPLMPPPAPVSPTPPPAQDTRFNPQQNLPSQDARLSFQQHQPMHVPSEPTESEAPTESTVSSKTINEAVESSSFVQAQAPTKSPLFATARPESSCSETPAATTTVYSTAALTVRPPQTASTKLTVPVRQHKRVLQDLVKPTLDNSEFTWKISGQGLGGRQTNFFECNTFPERPQPDPPPLASGLTV